MGRPIPEIRKDLLELADEVVAGDVYNRDIATRIRELVEDTYRNPVAHMTKPKRRKMTAAIGKAVRAYVAANPSMNLDEVGKVFNVAGGRVSEAINGKHFDPIVEGLRVSLVKADVR